MANTTYTVKKGDTLSQIAAKHDTTVSKLVELNDITDPDYIVVGQVLIISGEPSSSSEKKTTSNQATIKVFGLQSDTDRTVYATWTWTKSNTDNYKIIWHYATGDGVWFVGDDGSTDYKQSTYTAPSNATKVKFKVKPVAKKRKVNGKETSYWTAEWSTAKTYSFKDNPPSKPPVPDVTIKDGTLTAELDNLDINATSVKFQIIKNDSSVFNTGTAKIKTAHASYSCSVTAGNEYKVRCRGERGDEYGDWSEYSANVGTAPAAVSEITELKALSETSVYVDWSKSSTAKQYEIQYTTQKRYFDSSNEVSSMTVENTVTHAEVTGLETGETYYFRLRAVNDEGESAWTPIKSITIGEAPGAPTTWSSTTTAITGEDVVLYWVHNTEDGSSQTYAELMIYIDNSATQYTIKNSTDEDEKDKTSSYVLSTSEYTEGTKIEWKVRTAGITKEYGEWSIMRTIDVYAPPTCELRITDADSNDIDNISSFPFYIYALGGPKTQAPIGYHLTITSNETYETIDQIGNTRIVNQGEQLYSKHFDISTELLVEMSAGNIDLENNIGYTVTCTVSMNSGLTVEATSEFIVAWGERKYTPNAEIGIDEETYTASIRAYCEDANEELIDGVTLSVYRREFDGSFVELATGLNNTSNTYITDPHPSLDYARYRIVSVTESTGSVGYYDVPGYPVGGIAAIIQWDEEWSNFDVSEENELEQPTWSGSMLKLPYNINVSDSHDADVELIEYTGREHPVSYYGTQLGESSVWTMEIPKSDKETLYTLRRLAKWMGDVYVREPSGSGYWANITVAFSQKHLEVTIPITLNIIRVEGGV